MAISKELKERWIARLESPEAKWAGSILRNPETGGMCCLGHLADIQGHLSPDGKFRPPHDFVDAAFDEELCVLTVYDDEDARAVSFYGLSLTVQNDLAGANDLHGRFPIDMIRALPVAEEGVA